MNVYAKREKDKYLNKLFSALIKRTLKKILLIKSSPVLNFLGTCSSKFLCRPLLAVYRTGL